jgi:hypothetical protein
MSRVLKWNGRDVPEELRELPPGSYVLESLDRAPELTAAQEDDLIAALREADEGQGVSSTDARRRIDSTLKR